MGDPRKQRSKFSGPSHPWQRARIDEEKQLTIDYGFRNKAEIWKMSSKLRNLRGQAKKIIATKTEQSQKERELLLKKLKILGLISQAATIESILGISLKDILERRLESMVLRKGLAKSMLQARQFIVHEHISVGDRKITTPSYLVTISEESQIKYSEDSPLVNELHPERIQPETMKKKDVSASAPVAHAATGEKKEEKTAVAGASPEKPSQDKKAGKKPKKEKSEKGSEEAKK